MEMCAISSIFRYLDLDFFPELIDNTWKQWRVVLAMAAVVEPGANVTIAFQG
jgi:hypothetical protein